MLSALSVFLLLLVSWTPNPAHAQLIEGVQGRYFLVPALMVAMALAAPQGQQRATAKLDAVLRIRQRDVDGLYNAHPARALSDRHPS